MASVNLRISGPTPLPPLVLRALSSQMISHRGTGMMEAAIVNTLSPGDRVLGALSFLRIASIEKANEELQKFLQHRTVRLYEEPVIYFE